MSFDQKILELEKTLHEIAAREKRVTFAHSLGVEDMLLMDVIYKTNVKFDIFSIDTGRISEESYRLLEQIFIKYDSKAIKVFVPNATLVENFVNQNGINAFYQSVDMRKACCQVRKMEPLARALHGYSAWVTGLRRQQSVTRTNIAFQEWDEIHQMHKYNPLLDWTEQEVWEYIRAFNVPYNQLHDKHYPSIGCAPCTRAISVGEDVRAGRWWWENPESKECGLHAPISPLKKQDH